jgi:hypothetical protein
VSKKDVNACLELLSAMVKAGAVLDCRDCHVRLREMCRANNPKLQYNHSFTWQCMAWPGPQGGCKLDRKKFSSARDRF